MRSALIAMTLCALTLLTGCAVKKDFYAMGGSRADGTVSMAYDFKQFEQPVVNHQQALSIAKQKCSVWGYDNTEAFGGQTVNCQQRDGFGNCVAGQVVIQYQCLGNLDAGKNAPLVRPVAASLSGDISKEQWKARQFQLLEQETSLSYEEYMNRRKAIEAQ